MKGRISWRNTPIWNLTEICSGSRFIRWDRRTDGRMGGWTWRSYRRSSRLTWMCLECELNHSYWILRLLYFTKGCWVSGLCPVYGIQKRDTTFRKLNLFPFSCKGAWRHMLTRVGSNSWCQSPHRENRLGFWNDAFCTRHRRNSPYYAFVAVETRICFVQCNLHRSRSAKT
jgi:hypothetical protein